MTFYINPPRGTVRLDKLISYTHKRLGFLLTVYGCHGNVISMRELLEKESTMKDAECLIEGSKKDNISHFNLRYTSILYMLVVRYFRLCAFSL